MRGIENKELKERIRKAWATGRYKSYSALARVFHTYPNKIKRAIEEQAEIKKAGFK